MFEDDEEDADRGLVPPAEWAEYERLRTLAALQRVNVRACRAADGATQYRAWPVAIGCVNSVSGLHEALLAAGLKLPTLGLAYVQAVMRGEPPPMVH
jgi:hypothetical protein